LAGETALSTTNPTWTGPGSNHSGKPAINHLWLTNYLTGNIRNKTNFDRILVEIWIKVNSFKCQGCIKQIEILLNLKTVQTAKRSNCNYR
jgi:hypothetical protein